MPGMSPKNIAVLLVPLVLAACVSAGTSGDGTITTPPPPVPDVPASQFQADPLRDASFGDLLNGVRLTNGAPSVAYNSLLDQAAQAHAQDMLTRDYLSHTGRNGSSAGDRISDTGYQWRAWGENIAQGQQSEQSALNSWVGSPGHQANNVNPAFEEFALGRAGSGADIRWVLLLATPAAP